VDAKGRDLDHLTARIVVALKGQYKPVFHPKVDCGDYVVVINARDIRVEDPSMVYRWDTGFPGGKRELVFKEMIARHPTLVNYIS
jgi:large subunit ribosomal protein L13